VAAASATAIAFGDMNGDGGIDLAIGTAREPIVVFLNQSPPVPVELLNFSATLLHNSSVELRWETATETNNHGFSIERKVQEGKWLSIGFVSGKGTTTEKQRYQFIDITPSIGEAVYRLKQTDFDGTVHYSSTRSVVTARQAEFLLSQNFPNPFNPVTTIPVYIPNEEPFSLKVYDGLGGEVMTIFEGVSQRGGRNFSLNAGGLSSGIYYCALQTASARQVIPLLLQK
jgi:hypothetical protein